MNTPVALFIFNRPTETRSLINAIRTVAPKRIFVYADGARTANEIDIIEKTRAVIDEIDWNCKVERIFRTENIGLARSIGNGLTECFQEVEKLLIFEDDMLPNPTFFRFSEELLERYSSASEISLISGHCPQKNHLFKNHNFKPKESYYFSRYSLIWGWATWKRAWKDYRFSPVDLMKIFESGRLSKIFSEKRDRTLWEREIRNLLDTNDLSRWALRWTISNWLQERLSIVPSVNLVSHADYSGRGTHVSRLNPRNCFPTEPMSFPLTHPDNVIRNVAADNFSEKTHFHLGFEQKLKTLFWRLLQAAKN